MGGEAGSESEVDVPGANTGDVTETVEGVEGLRVVGECGLGEMGESVAGDRGERTGCGLGWDWGSGFVSGSMLSLKPLEEDALGGSWSDSTLSRKP